MQIATWAVVSAIIGFVWIEGWAAPSPTDGAASDGCRIVWGRPLDDRELSAGVRLGGLSDLTPAREGAGRFWAITDRGPNGIVERDGEKLRTLLAPEFVPSLVLLHVDPLAPATQPVAVEQVIPLVGPGGKPLSGCPIGGSNHLPVLSADGSSEIAPDSDGVDTEAVVHMGDGSFWIAEEYGPSLLKVGPDGIAIERHVPSGTANSAAAVPHRETIPGEYALRRDNRGFEAMAASPDGSRLWILLQSPLDNPEPKAAKKTGNVRLLVFDAGAGKPVAEHVYRMGDPTDSKYLTKGAPPDDGKLCCMAALGDDGLLVLEQDDEGIARLYAVSFRGATNTLDWGPRKSSDARSLEEVRDLQKAGIVPLTKRLVADLTPLRDVMAATADGGDLRHGLLKLEGLAIVDDRHVLLANDDDFGVQGKGSDRRRSFMWLIELDEALPGLRGKR